MMSALPERFAADATETDGEYPRLLGLAPRVHVDAPSAASVAAKRALDLTVAGLAMIAVSPVLILIAIAVKLTSSGPVFFVQERVGFGGRLFPLIKFRTMQIGTHDEIWASADELERFQQNGFKLPQNDARITRLGRFLRATSLDELPQLVNVVAGDMSLVGIRPLVPLEYEQRSTYDRACYRSMRPGLTGLWQVMGRSTVAVVEREALDREYVELWSNSRDVMIMLRTPAALLRFRHAA